MSNSFTPEAVLNLQLNFISKTVDAFSLKLKQFPSCSGLYSTSHRQELHHVVDAYLFFWPIHSDEYIFLNQLITVIYPLSHDSVILKDDLQKIYEGVLFACTERVLTL